MSSRRHFLLGASAATLALLMPTLPAHASCSNVGNTNVSDIVMGLIASLGGFALAYTYTVGAGAAAVTVASGGTAIVIGGIVIVAVALSISGLRLLKAALMNLGLSQLSTDNSCLGY